MRVRGSLLVVVVLLFTFACDGEDAPPDAASDNGLSEQDVQVDQIDEQADDTLADESECGGAAAAQVLGESETGVGGPLAIARPGDVILENDLIGVVIQGEGRNLAINPYGGNIIDADVVRAGEGADSFGELGFLINLAGTSSAHTVEVVASGEDCGPAVVRVVGDYVLNDYFNLTTGITILLPGFAPPVDLDTLWTLEVTTTYTLERGAQTVEIETTLENTGSDPVPAMISYLVQGGRADAWIPQASGYSLDRFGETEFFVFEGEENAYAVGGDENVEAGAYVSIVGAYALTHDTDLLDVLGFPNTVPELAPGESIAFQSLFVVAETHAEVTAAMRAARGAAECITVSGIVQTGSDSPVEGADVTAFSALGDDMAHVRTDAEGEFTMCLPVGRASLIAGKDGHGYAGGGLEPEATTLELPEGASPEPVVLQLPESGRLEVTVLDGEGDPLPARLTVYGLDPSPHSFRLASDGFDPLAPGVVRQVDSVSGAFGETLEPGTYQAVITRGPEYSMALESVTIEAGSTSSLAVSLFHVVDTAGYLSGDFHVHAQSSSDSTVRDEARVANMAAEGVEILVSTDHDVITDYSATITGLGLDDYLTTFPGQEITTFDYGHFNGFPLPIDPLQHNNGAVDWAGLTPKDIGSMVLNPDAEAIYQLNHPRAVPAPGTTGNYFNMIDLQFDEDGPTLGPEAIDPLTVRLGVDDDMLATNFVAMEVMTWANVQGLHDWYNLLNSGVVFTATGNSDTHTTNVESSGWPRNVVRVGHDSPEELTQDEFVMGLRQGQNTVSFGVFVTISAQSGETIAEIGDTVSVATAESVTVIAHAQSPTWVEFDSLTIIDGATGTVLAGGEVEPELVDLSDDQGNQRYEYTLTEVITPESDTWLIAIATGVQSLFPGLPYNETPRDEISLERIVEGDVVDPLMPFAITNPVWIDADDDGEITPSHLILEPDWESYRAEDRTAPY